ncbi:hypothetical protein JQ310_20470, partial [Leptospira interrogans]|nr:hypothetical protein [Leptospira interrogans]
MRAVQELLGHS